MHDGAFDRRKSTLWGVAKLLCRVRALYGMLLPDPMASEVSCSFLLQLMLAGALGLIASHLWLHQGQGNGLHATVADPCEDLIEKAKLFERFKARNKDALPV